MWFGSNFGSRLPSFERRPSVNLTNHKSVSKMYGSAVGPLPNHRHLCGREGACRNEALVSLWFQGKSCLWQCFDRGGNRSNMAIKMCSEVRSTVQLGRSLAHIKRGSLWLQPETTWWTKTLQYIAVNESLTDCWYQQCRQKNLRVSTALGKANTGLSLGKRTVLKTLREKVINTVPYMYCGKFKVNVLSWLRLLWIIDGTRAVACKKAVVKQLFIFTQPGPMSDPVFGRCLPTSLLRCTSSFIQPLSITEAQWEGADTETLSLH